MFIRKQLIVAIAALVAVMSCASARAQVQPEDADRHERKATPAGVQAKPTTSPQSLSRQELGVVQERQIKLEAAVTTFDELIRRQPPSNLTREQLNEWHEQTSWLRSVRNRYEKMAQSYSSAQSGALSSDMEQMNMQFTALQNSIQMEARKFQTLSNASRARHDIAMNSIRNTRA